MIGNPPRGSFCFDDARANHSGQTREKSQFQRLYENV
jgi:hypothetical protein